EASPHGAFLRALVGCLRRFDRSLKGIAASRIFRPRLAWPAVGFASLLTISMVPTVSKSMPVQNARQWPTEALDWCKEHNIHGNFFACPDYGTFIEWKLGEAGKAYTDTRGFSFSGQQLEDSLLTPQLCTDWQERVDRILAQGTDYFLLETTGSRGQL